MEDFAKSRFGYHPWRCLFREWATLPFEKLAQGDGKRRKPVGPRRKRLALYLLRPYRVPQYIRSRVR